eukprot:02378.XXX_15792_16127_1 [CDS] Oithona nana genome sequencing.
MAIFDMVSHLNLRCKPFRAFLALESQGSVYVSDVSFQVSFFCKSFLAMRTFYWNITSCTRMLNFVIHLANFTKFHIRGSFAMHKTLVSFQFIIIDKDFATNLTLELSQTHL